MAYTASGDESEKGGAATRPLRCGWSGPVRAFLATQPEELLARLAEQHRRSLLEPPAASQVRAWQSSEELLRKCFDALVSEYPAIGGYGVVFEYELPRERGRRPDVVLLSDREALVLEFKDTDTLSRAYVDQAAAYARDLQNYHAASRQLRVRPVLVVLRSPRPDATVDGVAIVSGATLPGFLRASVAAAGEPDLAGWLAADYEPLPTIVSAARLLFHREPLPNIRRAHSAGIPQTLHSLSSIAEQAQRKKQQHLAIVTGVPGSGKTLVGLQLVYSDRLAADESRNPAVFLSGNGPLVEVLQHALGNKTFVQDVHGFLKEYGGYSTRATAEQVIVYDEAQRAWDRNKSREKRGARLSQPEDFVRIMERDHDWGLLVLLLGEGQEIHVGEEAGLRQWEEALAGAGGRWVVHCPARLGETFLSAREVIARPELDLTASLRSHLAEDVTVWADKLLAGYLGSARAVAERIREQGFDIYLTGDLDRARDYVRTRYDGDPGKRYGLLASSKARDLTFYGVNNDFYTTRKVKIGPWYNSPPDDPQSCCALTSTVTEFGCQGLELDFPIVCWGSDLLRDEGAWRTPMSKINARDPRTLRLNSYRVLLTRGRDGLLIFVPPARRYEPTVRALQSAGTVPLS